LTERPGSRSARATDEASEFFHQLGERGHEPGLQKVTGTIRFDLAHGAGPPGRWLVTIRKGDVEVSRKNRKADCVVRMDRALFRKIASGEANPMAAFLRGAIQAEGDLGLLLTFGQLFPGPPRRLP
jgi:putative sterol carrier protein